MSDYFLRVGKPGSATTLSSPGHTSGGTSITVGSTANWPTTTKVAFAIDRAEIIGGEEVQIAGTYTEWIGQVTGATTIGSMTLSADSPNSDQNYSAGSLTRVYIPVSATRENKLIDGISVHANQDGTLITQAVRDALSLGTGSATGWEVGSLPDVSTVTANGNRSYTMTFASDVDSILSEGMRLRTTRTVATTSTCFSLDGSNDYFSKTSPAGMTFTDDFTVSVWVYLSSYTAGVIISRYNGTSGWALYVQATGQVQLTGLNGGSSNFSSVTSYQSLPLNKWVHIAAQLDMSTFTATTTTSYIMIDCKDVPVVVARGGTNPTALIQAGNLEIGSWNAGLLPFPGYLKDICIYNSKVTQATILDRMHQTPTGSETNLISAYTGANTTDLNTTNANNLTAQNGAVSGYASAPYGNRGVSTTLDYGLVMAVSGSSVTVQVPEGCTIPTSGGVSAVAYSTQANPYGWVSDKGRWEVSYINRTTLVTKTSPAVSTWYNLVNMTIPAGRWSVTNKHYLDMTGGALTYMSSAFTLSTSASSETHPTFTSRGAMVSPAAAETASQIFSTGYLSLSSATVFYLNQLSGVASATAINMIGSSPSGDGITSALPSGL